MTTALPKIFSISLADAEQLDQHVQVLRKTLERWVELEAGRRADRDVKPEQFGISPAHASLDPADLSEVIQPNIQKFQNAHHDSFWRHKTLLGRDSLCRVGDIARILENAGLPIDSFECERLKDE